MNKLNNDHAYMAQALRLARQGLYTTRTNPRVGCVIVKDGKVIGQGFHAYPGQEHAEVNALNHVQESAANSTMYVTLEPCSHKGKTPPCANALLEAKIGKLVIAMLDPNPLVNGTGIKYLEDNGIETVVGVMATESADLNKGFVQRVTHNRPYITAKSAMSLDGRTALAGGESKWISSESSRIDVQKLRARSCAILTGIETVIQDDPSLNVRLGKQELGLLKEIQQPKRIILDTQLRISLDAKILQPSNEVVLYTCYEDEQKREQLSELGVEIVHTEMINHHVFLESVMKDLSNRGFNEVLVEAGSTLVGNLLEHQLIDEFIVYMAPHLLGDASLGLAKLPTIQNMQDRIQLEIQSTKSIAQDLKITIKPIYH